MVFRKEKMSKKLFLFLICLGVLSILLSACAGGIPVASMYGEDPNYLGGYECSSETWSSTHLRRVWRKDTFFTRVFSIVSPLRAHGNCSLVTSNPNYMWVRSGNSYFLIRR